VLPVTYKRAAGEWYPEEPWVTQLLLQHIPTPEMVCDPCCGEGNIIKGCHEAGVPAFGYDMVDRGAPSLWGLQSYDALVSDGCHAPVIICNPPYERAKGTERFIRTMLRVRGVHTLAVLCEARMLFSKGRAKGLWRDHKPRLIVTIAPRPSMPPGEGLRDGTVKRGGGKQDYVWAVWSSDPACPTGVEFGLRINKAPI
jgi:hypothetical protein